MTPRKDLFKLVKTLSRSEKRYFTLDAQKGGAKNSNYFSLFKAINAMKEYDETDLKGKFPNLSMDKSYLYEAILKSMRDYRSPKSKGAQLKQHIIDSKFLYERGLLDQCANRLKTAKSIAHDLADSLALLEINREERKLAKTRGINKFNLKFDDFKAVKEREIKNINDEFKYFDIYDYLISEVQTKFIYTQEADRNELQIKYNPDGWEQPENSLSRLRFFLSKALYYHLLGRAPLASEYFQKSARVWDENEILKKEEFSRYIINLSNAIAVSFLNKEMDTVKLLLQKLRNQNPENFFAKRVKFINIIKHEINYVLETKDFSDANYLEKEVEKGISKFIIPVSSELTLMLQTAVMLMGAGDFGSSKNWLKKMMSFKKYEDRKDLQKAARVLNLLLVAETEDYEVVELLIRAYDRYFKKNFKLEEVEFELNFLSIIKNLIPFPMDKKEEAEFINYYEQIASKYQTNASYLSVKAWKEYKDAITK